MKAKSKQPINLFLLGDPTSGKSTHAYLLSKKYKLAVCDLGKEFNRLRKRDKKIDARLRRTVDKGFLAPTDIAQRIYREFLDRVGAKKGILFGGNPKMLVEAKLINRLLKARGRSNSVLVYLTIPQSVIQKRTQNRPGYNWKQRRADDNPEALKNRLAYWGKDVASVVKFWKQRIPFITLSSNGPARIIFPKLDKKLKPYLNA